MKTEPTFDLEAEAYARGCLRVVGVDEVGRGPLAGPVVAAAVWIDPDHIPQGLNDSKKLSAKRRQVLNDHLLATADVSIGEATVEEIDALNILRASHLAMERAVAGLRVPPDYVLIDGNMTLKGLMVPSQTVVKGDSISQSIAAASIVAKIRRDFVMLSLAQQYPGYGWEKNQGYPTAQHRDALQNLGVTPHHRRSFKPVHNML
ncbi:ribonuclease HII [Nereida sp. MMG025]|uniref:ribonuclease HII n=1 Tax=Nereida sp. MMG025 TaxID=2909981 RepID=UPI001F013DC2|nr:ribonuclease HII [Nereida sp. MMG025]MCF6444757.1 ribonuclease HII [Nereida sp. MMG025]